MNDYDYEETRNEPDEIIQEVRDIREAYSARHGNDVRAILDRSRERARQAGAQTRQPRRIVDPRVTR